MTSKDYLEAVRIASDYLEISEEEFVKRLAERVLNDPSVPEDFKEEVRKDYEAIYG